MRDFSYAVRHLLRAPGFTAIAITTLALGIAASTTLFGVVDAMVFRPSRTMSLDGLYVIRVIRPRSHGPLDDVRLRALERDRPPAIAQIAGVAPGSVAGAPDVTIQGSGRAERVRVEVVTGGYGTLFGVRPQTGRWIEQADDRPGADPVVVVSDRVWREWFGDDRERPLRTIVRINGVPFTVVGVAPRGFPGSFGGVFGSVDLWMTSAALRRALGTPEAPVRYYWTTLVRLQPSAAVPDAEGAIRGTLIAGPDAADAEGTAVRLTSARDWFARSTTGIVGAALVSFGILVLLAASANVVNMLLARGAARVGEVAVRLSLGASRGQIFRLFFAEIALIAVAAVTLGLTLAWGASAALNAAFPAIRSRGYRVFVDLAPDYRVVLFAIAGGAAAALVAGLLTAWRAARLPVARTMSSAGAAIATGGSGRGLRLGMVAVQVTTAVCLLMGAGYYVQAARTVLDRQVTFDTAPLATALIDLRLHGYHDARGRAFYDRLLRDVRALPGVESAALTDGFPGGVYAAARSLLVTTPREAANEAGSVRAIAGQVTRISAGVAGVSAGFLDTIRLPLLRGRDIRPDDQDATELVAIVSLSAASVLWPDQDAVGKRLMFGNDGRWRTVVGVSADPIAARVESPLVSPANLVLVPSAQWYRPDMVVVIRSRDPAAHLEAIRSAVHAIDPDVAAADVATAERSIMSWAVPMRAAMTVLGSLGLLALAIAGAGLHGVIGYLVTQRTREFGIRLALGALPGQIVRLVLDEARLILLLGLLAGVFLTAVAERSLQSLRAGFMPNEITTWMFVLLSILIVGLVAAFVPARRASRVDPNVALRAL